LCAHRTSWNVVPGANDSRAQLLPSPSPLAHKIDISIATVWLTTSSSTPMTLFHDESSTPRSTHTAASDLSTTDEREELRKKLQQGDERAWQRSVRQAYAALVEQLLAARSVDLEASKAPEAKVRERHAHVWISRLLIMWYTNVLRLVVLTAVSTTPTPTTTSTSTTSTMLLGPFDHRPPGRAAGLRRR
jgi:hypothetical protein